MDTSSSSYNSQEERAKEKRLPRSKYRKQKFNNDWLNVEQFKGWLEKFPNDEYRCRCMACNRDLNCGKSDLQKHSETKKHKENVRKIKNTPAVKTFFKPKHNTSDRDVDNFEIRLSLFFAEHNVAIHVIDHLLPLLKDIAPDSDIIKKAKLGRTKCVGIIQNVLAYEETQKLVGILKRTKFSVMIDESTDISTKKSMCILVRYISPENGQVNVQLLNLLPLGADCTAATLYLHFKTLFTNLGIPLTNIIGFCSDGANVMVGARNSFVSRLQEDIPQVIIIKCICHSVAIVASKACLTLPRAPEDLLRQIGVYVSGSSKRCSQLLAIQNLLGEDNKMILKTSSTRWLSHQKCVERILENWIVLQEFFKEAVKTDKLKATETILQELNNLCTKAYLLFLKYALEFFNLLNALFQSKKCLINDLHSESIKLFKNLGQNFIKPEALNPNINVKSPYNFLPIESVYLGPECMDLLKKIPRNESDRIRLDCLQFYIVALEEIQQRLPIKSNSIFKEMEFLNHNIALGARNLIEPYDFKIICEKLKIDQNVLIVEWRRLPNEFNESQKSGFYKDSIEQFWWTVSKLKNFNNNAAFPELSKVAQHMLSLPYANADTERIFSIVSDVKTKKRNKLSNEVLNAICVLRSSPSSESCLTFQCNESHFSRMNTKVVYENEGL